MFFSFELCSKETEEEERGIVMVVSMGHKREKKKICNDIQCLRVIGGRVDALLCEQRISCR